MKVIYKYHVLINDDLQYIALPTDAVIVHVGQQHQDRVTFWAELDTNRPNGQRAFRVYGTGHEFRHRDGKHVGTVVDNFAGLVWHLYETVL